MIKINFVCTGNICRSPSAEAVFRALVEGRGLSVRYHIDSSGTHGYHVGDSPDNRAVYAAQNRGISMEGITARKVTIDDFYDFDHIVAMDQGHYRILDKMRPADSQASLTLFTDYCQGLKIKDVPDPYYGTDEGFEAVLDILENGAAGLLKKLS